MKMLYGMNSENLSILIMQYFEVECSGESLFSYPSETCVIGTPQWIGAYSEQATLVFFILILS